MNVILYFVRRSPRQSAIVASCILFATLMDGIGLSAILPVMSVALRGDSDAPPQGYEAKVVGVLENLGIPRELEALIAVVVVAYVLKAGLTVLAKRRIGYAIAWVATDLRLRLLRGSPGREQATLCRQWTPGTSPGVTVV